MNPSFPADRFDDVPHDRARIGAHRVVRPRRSRWVTFAWAALATGVLVGAGTIGLLAINDSVSFDGVIPGASSAATDEAAPIPAVTPTVNPALSVTVLNGTSTAGLAAGLSDELTDAGWTVGTVSDADTEDFTVSTVYYSTDEAAALGVLETLGTGTSVQSDAYVETGADIVVVIGSDYALPTE